MYGGIYRDVRIVVNPQLYIHEPFVTFPDISDSRAKARILTPVKNDTENTAEVKLVTNVVNREDPSRMTVQVHNHFKDIAIADITDVIGRNRYFEWYEGEFSEDQIEVT